MKFVTHFVHTVWLFPAGCLMKSWKLLMLFILLANPALALAKNPLSEQLEKAEASYVQGDFKTAITLYEQLLQEEFYNAQVFYNLGNAYYRNLEKGKALAAYLKAHQLNPRHPDISANMAYVLEQGVDKLSVQSEDSWFSLLNFWNDRVSLKELFYGSMSFLGLAFLLFTTFLFWPQSLLKQMGLTFALLGLLCTLAWTVSYAQQKDWGAVSKTSVSVKSGPGEHNTTVFELHEGAPFILMQEENNHGQSWYKILLSDGKMGWVSKSDASIFLVPSFA